MVMRDNNVLTKPSGILVAKGLLIKGVIGKALQRKAKGKEAEMRDCISVL